MDEVVPHQAIKHKVATPADSEAGDLDQQVHSAVEQLMGSGHDIVW